MFDIISFKKFNEIVENCDCITCIGDENIANILGLEYNKSNINIDENTRLVVAKLIGGECPSNEKLIESNFEFYDIKYTERC